MFNNDTIKVSRNNVNYKFKAVCVGDVNGSYMTSNGLRQGRTAGQNGEKAIAMSDRDFRDS